MLIGEDAEVTITTTLLGGSDAQGGSSSVSEAESPSSDNNPPELASQRLRVDAISARLIGRVGGGVVADDLAQLAESLRSLAGITEAVLLDTVYAPLCSTLEKAAGGVAD